MRCFRPLRGACTCAAPLGNRACVPSPAEGKHPCHQCGLARQRVLCPYRRSIFSRCLRTAALVLWSRWVHLVRSQELFCTAQLRGRDVNLRNSEQSQCQSAHGINLRHNNSIHSVGNQVAAQQFCFPGSAGRREQYPRWFIVGLPAHGLPPVRWQRLPVLVRPAAHRQTSSRAALGPSESHRADANPR